MLAINTASVGKQPEPGEFFACRCLLLQDVDPRMGTRKTIPPSIGLERSSPALATSSADVIPPSPRVVLPSDLATSLRYLEEAEFQRLRAAVDAELGRRKRGIPTGRCDEGSASRVSGPVPSRAEAAKVAEIPEGKANLIRASFGAGLKPATIARTFGVPLSLVNRIIRSTEK